MNPILSSLGNDFTQGLGDVGQAIGGQKLIPMLPQSPSYLSLAQDENPKSALSDILSGQPQSAPQDLATTLHTEGTNFKQNPMLTIAGSVDAGPNVIGKVVAPDVTKSLFGAAHTADIQGALQRNGVTNSNDIGTAAKNLYDNVINPTLKNSPKLIKMDNITNGIVSEMRKMKPGLAVNEAKSAASGVISDMYDNARGLSGEPVPNYIDTPTIFNIKQALNDTQAVKNFFGGNPITDTGDLATVAARNALSNVIQTAHPAIAQATKDYGLLQDAVPSLYKETQGALADIAKQPSTLSKILHNPLLDTTLLGSGAILGSNLGANIISPGKPAQPNDFPNTPNGQTQTNQNEGSSEVEEQNPSQGLLQGVGSSVAHSNPIVPQTPVDVNTLPTNPAQIDPTKTGFNLTDPTQIKDANGNPLSISPDQYNQNKIAIATYLQNHPNDPVAANLAAQKSAQNDASYHADLIDSANTGNQAMRLIEDGLGRVNNTDPGLLGEPNVLDPLSLWGIGEKGIQQSLNPNYQQLSSDIEKLNALPGLNLSLPVAGSKAVAQQELTQAAQQLIANHNLLLQKYSGANLGGAQPVAAPPTTGVVPSYPANQLGPTPPSLSPAANGSQFGAGTPGWGQWQQ